MAGIDAIKNQSLYFAATQEAARQKAREASKNSKTATAKTIAKVRKPMRYPIPNF